MVNFYTRKVTGNNRNIPERSANSRNEGNLAKAFKVALIKRLNNATQPAKKKKAFIKRINNVATQPAKKRRWLRR